MKEIEINVGSDDAQNVPEDSRGTQGKNENQRFHSLFLLLLVCALGFAIALSVALVKNNNNGSNNNDDTVNQQIKIANLLTERRRANVVTWTQVGTDIDGLTAGDKSGFAVAMSQAGDTIVVGSPAPYSNRRGRVRVYHYNVQNNDWDQVGSTIYGTSNNDEYGFAVSMSDDGSVFAVGAPKANGGVGAVYTYGRDPATGLYALQHLFDGDGVDDLFGSAISISGDGQTLAVGAQNYDTTDVNAGAVYIYRDDGTNHFDQIGGPSTGLVGESFNYYFGSSLALSEDGNVIVIGGYGRNYQAGQVKVLEYDNNIWVGKGTNYVFLGDQPIDKFGDMVATSSDGNIIAISAPGDASHAGVVTTYEFNNNMWEEIGNIQGDNVFDQIGDHTGLSLSRSGTILAVGSNEHGSSNAVGCVRVYENIAGTWTIISQDIKGESSTDFSGFSVSLNGDGTMFIVGAPQNDGNDGLLANAGHACVFENTGS